MTYRALRAGLSKLARFRDKYSLIVVFEVKILIVSGAKCIRHGTITDKLDVAGIPDGEQCNSERLAQRGGPGSTLLNTNGFQRVMVSCDAFVE